ncbi:membrane protein DedA, SNARE-associated domain [Aureimonas altamirensis DSM 21988]|uniref:Membrane protein DedA, SNARE-associated domain n=1 Tax=Aureimonas altamirensis DSM 21988 TaxID=1121026 RepID=A0ABY1INC0_9HYPH|nr:DedA family protein [Aureimonas altamirensis]SHJ56692.1 membrane protein DedA, SNARE-associated domain [Aureimonas altamirensis DSM 21988]
MDSFLADLGDLIRTHQAWAFPIVTLISLGESLVLAGLLIPATAIMLLLGGLVGAGVVDPIPVLGGAILGAILGDILSYGIGRWLGPGVVYRKPLRRYRHAIARTRLFFRRYGFAAVFLGRFLGPIRSTVPLVAGMMAMSQTRFQLANVASAVLWAPLMLAPGYLGARGAGEVGTVAGEGGLGIVALALAITLVATVWGGKRFLTSRRPRRIRAGIDR